jgi:hypothetical protein
MSLKRGNPPRSRVASTLSAEGNPFDVKIARGPSNLTKVRLFSQVKGVTYVLTEIRDRASPASEHNVVVSRRVTN